MLHNNKMKINPPKPDHELDDNLSTDYQNKNISIMELNDDQESLVRPLLETCLRFGSHILDLMDDYDIDDVVNKNCSQNFVFENLIKNEHMIKTFSSNETF